MSKQVFDVIVAGIGSMGSAACYYLSEKGASVLGLEAHKIVNDEASHSGQTRIVRKAYFEHPDYVPLLQSAYEGWKSLEDHTGRQHFHEVGLAYFGKQNHPLLNSIKYSSKTYQIPLETLAPNRLKDFQIPQDYEAIFEPNAGFVCTDQVIKSYQSLAEKNGAELHEEEAVLNWEIVGSDIKVWTNKSQYTARKLLLTSGAGNKLLIPQKVSSLQVTRQLISWVKVKNTDHLGLGSLPCWVLAPDDEKGIYYGFPLLPGSFGGVQGLKVAHHYPGKAYEGKHASDNTITQEKAKIKAMMARYMPRVFDGFIDITSCLYTYSEDENFIVDFVPETDQKVVVLTGFSGHGFKFVPVLGEISRDLILEGNTSHPIDFLRINRVMR